MCESEDIISKISAFSGIGAKTMERFRAAFSETELKEAVLHYDVRAISDKTGLPIKKAAALLRYLHGLRDKTDFFGTARVEGIYNEIISGLSAFGITPYARGRLKMFYPLGDEEHIAQVKKEIEHAMSEYERIGENKAEDFRNAISGLGELQEDNKRVYVSDRVIIVDSEEEMTALTEMGVDRHIRVYTVEDAAIEPDDIVLYFYSSGRMDMDSLPNVISKPFTMASVTSAVPELVIEWARKNKQLLKKAAASSAHLGRDSPSAKILKYLNMAEVSNKNITLNEASAIISEEIDAENKVLKNKLLEFQLEGEDLLEILTSGSSPKLQALINDSISHVKSSIEGKLPDAIIRPLPVKDGYPLKIDMEQLERNHANYIMDAASDNFDSLVKYADNIQSFKRDLKEELRVLKETDYNIALALFIKEYDLHFAYIGGQKGFDLQGACHMGLRAEPGAVRVNYHLNEQNRIALLTGANSGGKTTLLETIVQIYIMAYCGLPVPADNATLERIDKLVFYSQQRNLNAGAFETFLRAFLPLAADNRKMLILADEMEAITELEAAGKIIATFLENIKQSDSMGIFVTHMASEITRYVDVRIDGIEARGLDENNRLVVDRSPRIGYLAHSTPELIIRRLRNEGGLDEKTLDLIDRILEKF